MAGELNRFDRWLGRTEEEIDDAVKVKPTTRLEACQLLATFKGIREEVEEKKLPEEIYEVEYVEDSEDEDYVDRGQLLRRLKNLKTSVNDNVARLETLCVCWNKLNADMNELTNALKSGGAGNITMEKLESSIAQIKDMFKERCNIIQDIANNASPNSNERQH